MPKLRGLRWWMMGLLMVGSIINYLTRSTLAVAAPNVLKDLSITTQQYSWILSGFQIAIMLQPICGYVMDTIGLKLGFAIFATAWSFVCMAHGLAGNWQMLFGLRALLGFAEGSANPAGMKATSEWFPATERGLAGGFFNMGASLGSMLAAPLVAWAILTHSWQFAFVLTGLIGLVWVALWLLCYEPPSRHRALSPGEGSAASSSFRPRAVSRPAIPPSIPSTGLPRRAGPSSPSTAGSSRSARGTSWAYALPTTRGGPPPSR